MANPNRKPPETILARGARIFRQNMATGFSRANHWRRHSVEWVEDGLDDLADWERNHKTGLIIGIALLIFTVLTIWFLVDVSKGKVGGNTVQTGVGGVIGGAIVGFIGSSLIAVAALLVIFLANKLFKLLAPIALFLPLILWAPVYALWQALVVAAKLLLLIPLFVLFVATRLMQLWRRIFFTCPSRQCGYQGLPIYECSKCGEGNRKLWPNLYGLLWHHCVYCDQRLPALDLLGRKELRRRCGGCEMPLLGKHGGYAPERLVAVIGGPSSGKTNYLLMTVNEIINGSSNGAAPIRGEIDDHGQAEAFQNQWRNLALGEPAAKTIAVPHALLLFAKVGKKRCQLYLYDAPGEEFTTISSMTEQQYIPLLEGFILLVDPLSFDTVRMAAGGSDGETLPLQNVVTSTLKTLEASVGSRPSELSDKRVAIVISKADLDSVKEQIGDIKLDRIASERCRAAIVKWGGNNALNAIEHRFKHVEYFACSPLGRAFDRRSPRRSREPFKGTGIIEPLVWVLTGQRS